MNYSKIDNLKIRLFDKGFFKDRLFKIDCSKQNCSCEGLFREKHKWQEYKRNIKGGVNA